KNHSPIHQPHRPDQIKQSQHPWAHGALLRLDLYVAPCFTYDFRAAMIEFTLAWRSAKLLLHAVMIASTEAFVGSVAVSASVAAAVVAASAVMALLAVPTVPVRLVSAVMAAFSIDPLKLPVNSSAMISRPLKSICSERDVLGIFFPFKKREEGPGGPSTIRRKRPDWHPYQRRRAVLGMRACQPSVFQSG